MQTGQHVLENLKVCSFESEDDFRWSIHVNATEQYFLVVLFIMLYKMVVTFESVDEIIKCVPFK